MTRIPRSIPMSFKQCRRWRPLAPLLCLWPALAAAQPSGPPATGQRQQIRIAASERSLWLAAVKQSGSRVFFRGASGGFDPGRMTSRRVAAMTTLDRDLLVFFDDASAYRYLPDTTARPTAEADLPQDQLPLDIASDGRLAYAIIPTAAAAPPNRDRQRAATAPAAAEGATPASQPVDMPSAALSLVKYDGRAWNVVAPLPPPVQPAANPRLRPRLYAARGELLVFAPSEQPDQILYFHLDAENNQWVSRGNIGIPGLVGFWVVSFRNELTLVAASPGPTGGETIRALRLLGDPAEANATARSWADLKFSPLPAGVTPARYTGAVGFNQHLGLLAIGTDGNAYLRFALIGAAPAEATLPVAEVLAQPGIMQQTHGFVQMATFILLLGMLAGLFIFRRGSMVNLIELPPGCALAFNLQRMLGGLIDFAPFALAAAVTLDVPWGKGLATLAKWGISPDPEGRLPEQKVLLWWALSTLGHTTYMLMMELLTRRSVGKVLVRVHLLSESGSRPAARQILTRNLTRLIELMPQFWIFIVLVLLSRNRQRMGDIFARTVAIRLTPVPPAAGTEPRPSASGSTEPRPSASGSDDKPAAPTGQQPSQPADDEAAAQPDADESQPPGAKPPDTKSA